MMQRIYRSISGYSPSGFLDRAKRLQVPAPVIYLVSVVASKAVSLVTLPIMAAYLPPAKYGNYDVIISFVEFFVLVFGLAIGATLIRFASTAGDEAGARRCARELVGTALAIGIVFGIPIVIVSPYWLDSIGIQTNHTALRVLVASITVAAMIELPLFWLRLQNRAGMFFVVVMARTLAQALLMWLVLSNGYGVPGLMIANGSALLILAGALLYMQFRDTGISVSLRALRQIATYGLPIVGAELAMFGLGNCNKLFMPGHVPPEVIAHFGLAARIALITSLATSPFELWWVPKRISVLGEPGGLELSARMWGLGIAIILLAASALALGGPMIIYILFPPTYSGANSFLLPLIAIQSLHVVTILTNVGSYARENGAYVFGIEVFSALVAVTGYLTLIPQFGAYGVIASMAAAQICRLTLHLWFGQEMAPLPYPWIPVIACTAVAVVLVSISPPHHWLVWRFLYTCLSLGVLTFMILATGLVKIPQEWIRKIGSIFGRPHG